MRILAIAPHPDDETLGCGGTLLKHKAAGDQISWCIVTEAREPQVTQDFLRRREVEIETVASAYGFESVIKLGLPTTLLDSLPLNQVINGLRGAIEETKPDCIYLNHGADVHSDHRVIFSAAVSAVKPFNTSTHGVKRILSYEVLSSTDAAPASVFAPAVFSDITPYIDRKIEIMTEYTTEVQPYPLPRCAETIRALARFRGASIGVEYAEAFVLVRDVF